MSRLWNVLPPATPQQLMGLKGCSPLLAQLLYNRGLSEPGEAERFLANDDRLQEPALSLPDMARATSRLYRALLSDELLAAYGDFDADGVCSAAVLVKGLSLLGARVVPYIPVRSSAERGLSRSGLDDLHRQGVTLVVTGDCGITAVPEVEYARQLGMDVIITDHHVPLHDLPAAVAVVDPRCSPASFSPLAGVGVSFKLIQALYQTLGRVDGLDDLLDLVAVGTVTDMVPLIGENRYLVARGLEVLNRTTRPGLLELVRLAGLQLGSVTEDNIAWALGPRLNAGGRMDHGLTSYELLVSDSAEKASALAQELDGMNAERQRLTELYTRKAEQQLTPDELSGDLLMPGGADFPEGVLGLVAGRLVDRFRRPAVAYSIQGDLLRGSSRSIDEFDLVSAFKECEHLLTRFGGHPKAAGFAAPASNLPELRRCLQGIAASRLAGLELRPVLNIDCEVALAAVNGKVYKEVQRLAPFGEGNPAPVLLSRNVEVLECRSAGASAGHLKLKLRHNGMVWGAIAFDQGPRLCDVPRNLDIVYSLAVNPWGGQQFLELNILDFATP